MLAVGERTLRSMLADRVAASADRPFLIFEANDRSVRRLTYGEFDAAVNRTAHLLRALGLAKGDTFNLHLPNCPEFLFFWFAAARIGAVMVPTNILSTADEMQYILQHSESRLAVTMPSIPVLRQATEEKLERFRQEFHEATALVTSHRRKIAIPFTYLVVDWAELGKRSK